MRLDDPPNAEMQPALRSAIQRFIHRTLCRAGAAIAAMQLIAAAVIITRKPADESFSFWQDLLWAAAGVLLSLGAIAFVYHLVVQWLDAIVMDCFHKLADAEPTRSGCHWRETAPIVDRIQELRGRINELQAHSQRQARRIEAEFRQKEIHFDRQIRHARHRATMDPLTGLRNRGFVDEEMPDLVEDHRVRGEDLSVVMLDVDNFKAHNDRCGHRAGDEILRFVGELLRGSIRATDQAVRYGGDEFLLVLPGACGKVASRIVERVIKLFAQYTATIKGDARLSMSAGVSSLKDQGCENAQALLAVADSALYASKRVGKNSVTCEAV